MINYIPNNSTSKLKKIGFSLLYALTLAVGFSGIAFGIFLIFPVTPILFVSGSPFSALCSIFCAVCLLFRSSTLIDFAIKRLQKLFQSNPIQNNNATIEVPQHRAAATLQHAVAPTPAAWQPLFAPTMSVEKTIIPYNIMHSFNIIECSDFTQKYLANLAKKPKKLSEQILELQLSNEEEKLFEQFRDPITCEYMDFPVSLHEQNYDIVTLCQLPKRQDPFNNIPFVPTEIQSARSLVEKLKETISEVLKSREQKHQEYASRSLSLAI